MFSFLFSSLKCAVVLSHARKSTNSNVKDLPLSAISNSTSIVTNMKSDEAEQTERVRNKGQPNGLFRSCMDKIKHSHGVGQTLRTAKLAAGLLSDKNCYAELLVQFYVVTKAMEKRMDAMLLQSKESGDTHEHNYNLLRKVKNDLGYAFCHGYERDLEYLLGQSDWEKTVETWTTQPAMKYMERMMNANEDELVAAAFILWGPLVIGGGAALKPRVTRAFGVGATHVFEDVVGPRRAERRHQFIQVYDTLLDSEEEVNKKKETFNSIVQCSGEFMDLNNEMMMAVRQRPWWYKYILMGAFFAVSMVPARYAYMHLRK